MSDEVIFIQQVPVYTWARGVLGAVLCCRKWVTCWMSELTGQRLGLPLWLRSMTLPHTLFFCSVKVRLTKVAAWSWASRAVSRLRCWEPTKIWTSCRWKGLVSEGKIGVFVWAEQKRRKPVLWSHYCWMLRQQSWYDGGSELALAWPYLEEGLVWHSISTFVSSNDLASGLGQGVDHSWPSHRMLAQLTICNPQQI